MMSSKVLRLPAPAKLNLMLRVLGRRPDGYHLLQTVFQFIDRSDWITLEDRRDGRITLENTLPGVPAESDLTVRAARLLKRGVRSGGSGGNSVRGKAAAHGRRSGRRQFRCGDCPAGLNALWGLKAGIDDLASLGLRLGADVPVFVRGQAAWAEGVGEHLQPLPELPEPWYVVLVPPCHVATGAVFSAPGLTRDNKPIKIADFLAGQQDNHCLSVVSEMYPPVVDALRALGHYSEQPRLTGTGACVFAAFASEGEAQAAAAGLAAHWQGFVAKGMNISPLHRQLGPRRQLLTVFLGRRQAVRHGVLIPAYPGSNPGAPAIFAFSLSFAGVFE